MDWQWFADNKEILGGVGAVIAVNVIVIKLIQYFADLRVNVAQDRAELAEKDTESAEKREKATVERAERAEARAAASVPEADTQANLAREEAAERREAEMRSMVDTLGTQVRGLRQARAQDKQSRGEDVAALHARLDSMNDGVVTREELEALRGQVDRLAAEPSATAAPLQQVEDTAGQLDLTARAWEEMNAGWDAIYQRTSEALQAAIRHFRRALEIRPKFADAYWGWGNALGYLGNLAVDEGDVDRARSCYKGACEKYEQALGIKPDSHGALSGWAAACLGLAHVSEGEEREQWLTEAERLAAEAEAIKPGAGIYNLACVHALQGREDEAFAELRKALAAGVQMWSHVADDRDWVDLRDHPEYKKLEAEFGGDSAD